MTTFSATKTTLKNKDYTLKNGDRLEQTLITKASEHRRKVLSVIRHQGTQILVVMSSHHQRAARLRLNETISSTAFFRAGDTQSTAVGGNTEQPLLRVKSKLPSHGRSALWC